MAQHRFYPPVVAALVLHPWIWAAILVPNSGQYSKANPSSDAYDECSCCRRHVVFGSINYRGLTTGSERHTSVHSNLSLDAFATQGPRAAPIVVGTIVFPSRWKSRALRDRMTAEGNRMQARWDAIAVSSGGRTGSAPPCASRRQAVRCPCWRRPSAPTLFTCSAATPPGCGLQAMCDWNAAGVVLSCVA